MYNGNAAGAADPRCWSRASPAIAALVKIYSVPMPRAARRVEGRRRHRRLVLLVTIPILPWAADVAEFSSISATLRERSDGGDERAGR